jgi:hypothetical protein
MTKQEFLSRYNISEDQFSGKEAVGGYLDLGSVTTLPDGFNPTVGGYLDLRSVTTLPDGFNPTVGGYLDLRSVTTLPDGFNPTVGGYLYWKNNSKKIGKNVRPVPRPRINKNFFWEKNNKKYAMVDGIFCEIISEKQQTISEETITVFSAKKVNKEESFFIVKKDDYCAHGEDLRKAFEDVKFKVVAEKLKNEPINPDTEITINHYRLITGACEMGVKNWMEQNNIKVESIMAKDLMPILKKSNAYGFEKFKTLITF